MPWVSVSPSLHTQGQVRGVRLNRPNRRSAVWMPYAAGARPTTAPGVLLVTTWYGGSSNGVALVVESLAQALHKAGVPLVVLELMSDGWLPRVRRGTAGETILSVCVRDPKAARSLPRRLAAELRGGIAGVALRRNIRRDRLRVAHFHYAFAEYDVLRRIVQRSGLPIVCTFHGNDLDANLDDPPTRTAIEHLVRAAAVVTTVSDALRRRLVRRFPFTERTARTIHNAIPAAFVGSTEAHDARTRDVDVLFVGNLIPRKGVDVLLRALAIVHERRPTIRAIIAGDGAERAALESLTAELSLDDAVEFKGAQERDDLVALYQRARVAVVPSRAEPFGLVVVEAMASGAAVVATRVGGIKEIAAETDGVTLVPPDDSAALASAISDLLEDDAHRARVASDARGRVLAGFGPEAIRDAYIRAYATALGMDGARSHG